MSKLATIQRQFAEALLSKRPLEPGTPGAMFAEAEVKTSGALGGGTAHVEVYREQFGLRHRASLTDDFPALRAHVAADEGEQAFDALLADYLAQHPPAHYTLLYAGHALAAFMEERTPSSPAHGAFRRDLARFEYALVALAELADAPPLSMEVVSAVPEEAWPGVRLVFHPTLTLLDLSYPVHLYRGAVERGERPSTPEPAPTYLAVARTQAGVPTYLPLDPDAYVLLGALLNDRPLRVAGEEPRLAEWFQNWIAWGWVTDLKPE